MAYTKERRAEYQRNWKAESSETRKARKDKRNLAGQVFGKLTAIGSLGLYRHNMPWICECECGNITTAHAHSLKIGTTKSCGRCVKQGRKAPGVAAKHRVLSQYVQDARRRHLAWCLSDGEFDKLTSSPCHYCGCVPEKVEKGSNGSFVYNGIDRADNRIGYTTDNSVSCCQICNLAKREMSVDKFLNWAKRVARHNEVN